jgi:hypothetical protein
VEIAFHQNGDGQVQLRLATYTPSFDHFAWRFDAQSWHTGTDSALCWLLHEGLNMFEIRSVNKAGKEGRVSVLEILVSDQQIVETKLNHGSADVPGIHFQWENSTHPILTALREQYKLDEIIQAGETDLEKAILLRDWVKSLWDHDQPIYSPPLER